jgi:hypothetical protein
MLHEGKLTGQSAQMLIVVGQPSIREPGLRKYHANIELGGAKQGVGAQAQCAVNQLAAGLRDAGIGILRGCLPHAQQKSGIVSRVPDVLQDRPQSTRQVERLARARLLQSKLSASIQVQQHGGSLVSSQSYPEEASGIDIVGIVFLAEFEIVVWRISAFLD